MTTWLSESVRGWWNERRRSARRTTAARIFSRRARLETLESRVLLATLNGHTVLLDDSGKIVPWDTTSPNAYDSFLDQRWNFIKTQVPNSPGSPPVSNYPQYYFFDGYATTNPTITPDNWMNDIGEKIPNWVESGRLYYAYTGDMAVMNIVHDLVDYTIDHGTSPSNFAWPNFPHTTNNYGQAEFTGFTGQFALHEIQVDHAADMGLAYYRMYQFYGDQKYLTAAVNVADVLAPHARVGTVAQSVWPYRVKLDSGTITAQYGANWAGAYSLLTELVAANIGNVSAYAAAASKARDFILNYPMKTLLDQAGNMAGNWTDGHSDVPINSNTYKSNMSNSNVALYILAHPEFDPNWQTNLPAMINWTEKWFVTRTTGSEPATSFGANVVGEQDSFNYKMDYQTARYAAECALWYRQSGDAAYLEKAYRSLNWVTYCSAANGRATESPYSTWIASWWSDCYGEGPRMFYQAFAAMPEWAPAGENHLLYSEDVVHDVSYANNHVGYIAASGDGIEYLRVKFLPGSVMVGGAALTQRSDFSAQGYTLRSLGGGDYALAIHRTGAVTTAATVSIDTVSAPSIVAPASASPSPATGTITALSVFGADDAGENNLVYTWSVLSKPTGATVPTFSLNGTNAAKNTTAAFSMAGLYTFRATVRDADNLNATSDVSVIVSQSVTTIVVTPASISLLSGESQQYATAIFDQFGATMTAAVTWSSTGGTIAADGRYTAGVAGGTYLVTASAGGKQGSDTVNLFPTTIVGTDNSDNYTVRLSSDGLSLQVWNGPVAGLPTYSIDAARISILTFSLGAGDDTLTLDGANGSPLSSYGLAFDGGAGSDTLIFSGGAYDVNDAFFSNIGGGNDELIINGATLQINQPNAISDNTSVAIRGNGVLDLGGHTETIAALTLESGSLTGGVLNASSYTILNGTITATLGRGPIVKQTTGPATITTPIDATTVSVQSGQLTAASIVADSLSIGAFASAAIAEPVPKTIAASQATTSGSSFTTPPAPVKPESISEAVAPVATQITSTQVMDLKSMGVRATTRTKPIFESPILDRMTLLLAMERSSGRLSKQRHLRTLDAVLAAEVSFLRDSPDIFAPATCVRRKMRLLSESLAHPSIMHIFQHSGP